MEKTFIGVRDVDIETFRKFRAKAIEDRIALGKALTEAMHIFLDEKKNLEKVSLKNLEKIKGIIKTKKKVRWSEEIDKILYGSAK